MADQPGQDFFISYTAVNRPWAEWIAVRLEQAGYTTLLQAGTSAPAAIYLDQHALTAARTVAVCRRPLGSAFGEGSGGSVRH